MSTNKDNQLKNKSGKNAKQLISDMLFDLKNYLNKNLKIIMEIQNNYSVGYPGQKKQFKIDYKISFPNDSKEQWLIKSTNSIRERIYGTEFFAQNIRIVDPKITNIFVVVPDSISFNEKQMKINYSKKIKSNDYTSFLTDVLTVNELRKRIIAHFAQNISQGLRSNILGKDAETEVINLLQNPKNIELWNDYNSKNSTVKSYNFDLFKNIITKSGLRFNIDKINSILATDHLPKLLNGGNPKTDVSFELFLDSKSIQHNISIKNSTAKIVTVHEGSIENLISALNLSPNEKLYKALIKFQEGGSEKYLTENFPEEKEILCRELPKYNEKLIAFFIFGDNSPLISNSIQIADMILYTHNIAIWNKQEYIETYNLKYSKKGQFGTPFKWTYPSKKRGTKIQIKAFTNNE